MSLEALGVAIRFEEARSIRRTTPGASTPRTADEAVSALVPFDEEFELASRDRALAAEIFRTEVRSRIAAHHLERIFDFRRRLDDADRAAENALDLAERAARETSEELRARMAEEASELLGRLSDIPGPTGTISPPRGVDFSTPEAALSAAQVLGNFRQTAGESIGRLDRMRDVVLANIDRLKEERRSLRSIPNGRPSPRELRERVETVRASILANPRRAKAAQANLPRGVVLSLVQSD